MQKIGQWISKKIYAKKGNYNEIILFELNEIQMNYKYCAKENYAKMQYNK